MGKNFCIITSSYPLNPSDGAAAAGVFVRDFAIELAKLGNKVYVLTHKKPGEVYDDKEIHIIRFPWKGGGRLSEIDLSVFKDVLIFLRYYITGQSALLELIRQFKIDYIICMWAVPSGLFAYIANKFFGIPYIIWVLGSDIWIYGRKKFTKFILRGILKNSLKLYADGEELRGETELISGKLCEFLPSSRILPQDNLPEITLNNNKINFLFIGRYHPHKGVDILIDAIHLLPKEISDRCHFHLYGGGQLEKFIKNKIREYELNNVSIKGYVDMYELSALMRTAHFLIIPSRKDSIPVVFSDALQCGLPMIVSRVGDMGKLVEKYGIGFSFEKENQTELSQLIIKVISLKKEFFCDNIQKARRFFDVRKACITIINDINAAP